jgi:hypothetical protein
MWLFNNLFNLHDTPDNPALLAAIERAVSAVEPLLKQTDDYPDRFRQPVSVALEYAKRLAYSLPGPVTIDREAYARDAFVHALFPDINAITDAVTSSLALQEYLRKTPASNDFYALMGTRRIEKKVLGMELSASTLQREVPQQAVYFSSHTLENPSPDESHAREMTAMRFFDSLAGKVKELIEQRKQNKEALIAKRNALQAQLHTANAAERTATEHHLAEVSTELRAAVESLELERYLADFKTVLLHPEEYLHLNHTSIILDSMGIRRTANDGERGQQLMFSELIGYDRRDWTLAIVHCTNIEYHSFAERLEKASRYLTLY